MIARIAAAVAAWALCFLLSACAGVPSPFQQNANAASAPAPGARSQQSSPQAQSQTQQGAQPQSQTGQAPSGFADPDAGSSNEYRLGPGDVVRVTVYGNDDLT